MVRYNWCIDAGNSSIKWGVFRENEIMEIFQFREEPSSLFMTTLEEKYPPESIAVCSVRGDLTWLKFHVVKVLSADSIAPFFIDYSNPSEMGLDRLAASMGARFKFPQNSALLVVDLGTCVTYTSVKDWCVSGLAIAPGLQMRWNAMSHFTVQLPLVSAQTVVVGNGTQKNLYTGGLQGWRTEMEGMIDLFCETLHFDQVVITGSDVVHLETHFKERFVVVDHLNLWGLNYWLNEG